MDLPCSFHVDVHVLNHPYLSIVRVYPSPEIRRGRRDHEGSDQQCRLRGKLIRPWQHGVTPPVPDRHESHGCAKTGADPETVGNYA